MYFLRYLYPVDKNRIDMSGMIEETPENEEKTQNSGVVTRKKAKKE